MLLGRPEDPRMRGPPPPPPPSPSVWPWLLFVAVVTSCCCLLARSCKLRRAGKAQLERPLLASDLQAQA